MQENRQKNYENLEEQDASRYVLPVRFGAKRRIATAVILIAIVLALAIPEAFSHSDRLSTTGMILEVFFLLPFALVVLILAFVVTSIVMKIYRKTKKYRPLADENQTV